MERIIKGLHQFQSKVFPTLEPHFKALAHQQHPEALFITCADSRIVPQLITQTEAGDLFICRNAGNMVPSYVEQPGGVAATIEYAVQALGVRHVIVCGHSDCGAMKGVLNPEKVAEMPAVARWLAYGAPARRIVLETCSHLPEQDLLTRLAQENVIAQLKTLETYPAVAAARARGELELHGWMYDIATGGVEFYDEAARRFRPHGRSETTAAPQPHFTEVA